MLETSDAWTMSRLSHRPSEPAYYIEDCRISTSPFQLVSLHLLSIQFVLAILLAGFMMMFKKKRWLALSMAAFFFGLHCSNFLSQVRNMCNKASQNLLYRLSYLAQCQAIVTEIILDLSFGRCYCCKTFLIPWRLFFESELPMYLDAPKIRF